MQDSAPPLDELQDNLLGFIDQTTQPVLILTCFDEELPLVVRTLDAIDAQLPSDVVLFHTDPVVGGAASYVDGLVRTLHVHVAEANEERADEGHPPLAPLPPGCFDRALDPFARMQLVFAHVDRWLPAADGHRFVLALLPESIVDRDAHGRLLGSMVPFHGNAGWPPRVRLVVRDDRKAPFVVDALRDAGVKGPFLYTTRLTVNDLADAVALDAGNLDLPPARRMAALLQCATFDVGQGRHEAALEKFGVLYTYYEEHKVLELQATVLYGVGDVMQRLEKPRAAQEWFVRGLQAATAATSLPLILQLATALANLGFQHGAYPQADVGYALGATTAEKLLNLPVQSDLLERCGEARAAQGNLAGAVAMWNRSAIVARELTYDARLLSVLVRLRDASASAGYRDVAAQLDAEWREVRMRAAAGVS